LLWKQEHPHGACSIASDIAIGPKKFADRREYRNGLAAPAERSSAYKAAKASKNISGFNRIDVLKRGSASRVTVRQSSN
jgi:hypothetical protein